MFDERGEGGVLEGVGGLRGVPGDSPDGDGRGGKGWDSCFALREVGTAFETFSSIVRSYMSGDPSSYSSVKASNPAEPVLL